MHSLVALATPAANCFIAAARGCVSANEWPSLAFPTSWADAIDTQASRTVAASTFSTMRRGVTS
jgi:hypothetical protein